jgi:hypothetical protein
VTLFHPNNLRRRTAVAARPVDFADPTRSLDDVSGVLLQLETFSRTLLNIGLKRSENNSVHSKNNDQVNALSSSSSTSY